MFINNQHQQKDRFSKVFKKLNSSYQQRNSTTILPQSSTENSFYRESSVGYSDDRSVKLNTNTPFKYNKQTSKLVTEDQESVLLTLFEYRQVLVNRQRKILKTQFVPTSNGFKYILVISQKFYINLCWLHSVQQLEKNKLLILYYDMNNLTTIQRANSPKIESLIIEFSRQMEMVKMFNAINFIHRKYHDEDVEKLYHLICSDSNTGLK